MRVGGLLPHARPRPSVNLQASAHSSFFRRLPVQVVPVSIVGRSSSRLVVRAAAFDNLASAFSKALKNITKDGLLTPDNIKEPIREIRRALLEADVSLPIVRRFVKRIEESAVGVDIVKGVTADQQLVKVVYDELAKLMGGQQEGLNPAPAGQPQVILMAGLQGVGKTTACGKLALYQQKTGKKVMMVATDVYRPAAIEQLVTLGKKLEVPVFELGNKENPVEIARRGIEEARKQGVDTVIVDTAGRLTIDPEMMAELRNIKGAVGPTDILLVVDAMTGQEAANLVRAFNDEVGITGAVLTKLDGDSRGGAALSIREVSGKPIKFTGIGEKLEALEVFYPDRMAQRILGMGDVLTLVEKATEAIKEEEAASIAKRLLENKFDFNDFLKQYKLVSSMGTMQQVMKMLPGMSQVTDKQMAEAEKNFKMFESMINSMTPGERANPELLAKSASRRARIAKGAGRTDIEVANMLAMFTSMRSRMQNLSKMIAEGGMMGLPGIPSMTDEEMLNSTLAGYGPRKVAPGTVRRKRKLVNSSGKGFASAGSR